MIDSRELRRGNYVDTINRSNKVHLPNNNPIQVFQIGVFEVDLCKQPWTENKQFTVRCIDLSPVLLTEEILLKCGFTFRTDTGFDGWYSNPILGESIRIFEVENGYFKYASAHTVLKYLHQLQNLYFALTEKELEINF